MPDLPENLKPLSLLIEVVHQLQSIKAETIKPLGEVEEEFLSVLRQIKGNTLDKIFTCSHSLELLLEKYSNYANNCEHLETRIAFLEKENFDLKKELTEK